MRTNWTNLLLTCAACALAACGGGGGGGGGTPEFNSPPPPPPNYVKIFPGVTTTTNFAVLGYEASGTAPIGDGFSVRYDAAQQAYIIDTPFFAPGKFDATSEDAVSWNADSFATVLKPKPANPASDFEYTTLAKYYGCPWDCFNLGVLAFGTATPQLAVPTTGIATYDAIVAGITLDTGLAVGGTASLQFDFAAGTLAGSFEPILNPDVTPVSLGQYSFLDTVYGVGDATFSGGMRHTGNNLTGAFNGLFTGPNAQELMARWTASYVNPSTQQNADMFGVWIGKDGGP